MKKRIVIVLVLVFLFAYNGIAKKINYNMIGQCTAFFKNGNIVSGTINFMSTRHPKIGFINQGKFNLRNIWMLNFMNNNWNFPNERKLLKRNSDTIFLKNGQAFYDKVITYSTKFKVFRFKNTRDIHVTKIKRIYFCCNILPKAYKDKLKPDNNVEINYTTFLVDGRVKNIDIKYYNNKKTGFVDGLQVNSKDIIMINFENKKKYFKDERKYLKSGFDAVFLKDRKYIIRKISTLDFKTEKIILQDGNEIDLKKVIRIYFKEHLGKSKYPIRNISNKIIRKNLRKEMK